MKRAEVAQIRHTGKWWVSFRHGPAPESHLPIGQREVGPWMSRPFPTHAAALAHALAETGLTKKTGDES